MFQSRSSISALILPLLSRCESRFACIGRSDTACTRSSAPPTIFFWMRRRLYFSFSNLTPNGSAISRIEMVGSSLSTMPSKVSSALASSIRSGGKTIRCFGDGEQVMKRLSKAHLRERHVVIPIPQPIQVAAQRIHIRHVGYEVEPGNRPEHDRRSVLHQCNNQLR